MLCYNVSCLAPTVGVASTTFSTALQFFAAATCLLKDDSPPDANVCDCEEFDFIIVGGGTAGCVVANRLSENEKWKILLIEAGGKPPIESKIPNQDSTMFQTEYDWRYRTTYNGETNNANKNNYINWPRGKQLGGSSNINAMLYVRGNRNDFQRWYDAGNKEWHPDIVFEYYKKIESLQNRELLDNPETRQNYGSNGPVVINRFNSTYRSLTDRILRSWDELNIKNVFDLNTANVMGSGVSTVTAYNGFRASSDRMYLNPVQDRPNLKVLKNTLCTRVLINSETKVAYGVEVDQNGNKKKFLASREVIISAGTINTPQLLVLSGVGEKEYLQSLNIKPIVDLPAVGENLQDHCTIPVTIFGDGPREKSDAEKNFDAITYLYNGTGELAQSRLLDALAFYSLDDNATYPDFQNHILIFRQNSSALKRSLSNVFNYQDSIVNYSVELNKNHTLYFFIFNLLHPLSRGSIKVISKDPKDHPLIYANYFHDRRDLISAVAGIKKLTQILHTKSFKPFNAFLGRMNWPACNEFEIDSNDYWECVCINMVYTVYHPVGTANMGPDPATSVVDGRLRVHKMKNLRVIDASVMPTLTSGNTQAPTYMVAERASDLVKEDHGMKINS
ncbi:glucose dehydrogenase [FAD, quinone] [Manduca sexta]|uniref:Glucose-methanol-choline oxidoreductase N-terminal domain-containing protein n=1 Tax=Manduca sexta TaxID=7130 RepID=A0A921YUM9_MANSE|nr:glucose dehydrogenase [FAD, quinone] [Manduca sexta]KAG6445917.1 hypothetical protein O3G_MSEX004129 [Manduca sexta]